MEEGIGNTAIKTEPENRYSDDYWHFCASGVPLPVNARVFYVAVEPIVSDYKEMMRFIILKI